MAVTTQAFGAVLLIVSMKIAAVMAEGSASVAQHPPSSEEMARRMFAPFAKAAKLNHLHAEQQIRQWKAERRNRHHHKGLRGAGETTLEVHAALPSTTVATIATVAETTAAPAAETTVAAMAEATTVQQVTVAASSVAAATSAPAVTEAATTVAETASPAIAAAVVAATVAPQQAPAVSSTAPVEELDDDADDDKDDDVDDVDADLDDQDGSLSGSAELVAPVAALHAADSKANMTISAHKAGLEASAPACQCEANNPGWVKTTRTVPECVFIDLGAANGNTFQQFINNAYGPVANCPSGKYQAVLVEANPRFSSELWNIGNQYQGIVDARYGTAAYMCEGQTSFFVDTVNTQNNFWGSSLSANHPDVQASGMQQVVVNTLNLNRYLYENTIPGDWVMVKMDIEGAEWEVIPCLAESPAASLIDRLYLEEHPQTWSQGTTTAEQMQAAKVKLQSLGVDIPSYFSQTL